MSDKYPEEKKELLMMTFLTKYGGYRPYRMSKEKINNSLAKYWDSDEFWFNCADKFELFSDSLKYNSESMIKAATSFWWMLDKGLPKKGKELEIETHL